MLVELLLLIGRHLLCLVGPLLRLGLYLVRVLLGLGRHVLRRLGGGVLELRSVLLERGRGRGRRLRPRPGVGWRGRRGRGALPLGCWPGHWLLGRERGRGSGAGNRRRGNSWRIGGSLRGRGPTAVLCRLADHARGRRSDRRCRIGRLAADGGGDCQQNAEQPKVYRCRLGQSPAAEYLGVSSGLLSGTISWRAFSPGSKGEGAGANQPHRFGVAVGR